MADNVSISDGAVRAMSLQAGKIVTVINHSKTTGVHFSNHCLAVTGMMTKLS